MSEDDLPEGWRLLPLDEVASVEDGRRVPLNSEERATRRGPYPYFGANGQVDSIDEYRYEGDHVLVAEDGGYYDDPSRAVAYLASGRFWVNNHAHVLRAKPGVETVFLRDALNRVPWMEFVSGSTRLKLTQAALRRVQLPVAPLEEQRRIVAKLDALRARSRRAKDALDAVPALLDRLRQSILAAAFRGDLTADWREQNPDVEPASELLKRIRIERRTRWEEAELAKLTAKGKRPKDDAWKAKYVEPEPVDESDLPELPEGWCWATFETVGTMDLGRQLAPQYMKGVGVRPYLRVANVKDDRIDFSDVNEMDFDSTEFEHYHLESGDILLSEGQSPARVGQSAIYRGEIPGLCFQKTLHRFRRFSAAPPSEYFQLLCRHYVRSGAFRAVASLTTNIAHLTLVRLKPLPIPLPPLVEATEIIRRATALLDAGERAGLAARGANEQAENLDRSILAAAFRGELLDRQSAAYPGDQERP